MVDNTNSGALAAQLRATLDQIPAYTWYALPTGGLTFVNARCGEYLALPSDHPLRLGIDTGAAVPPGQPLTTASFKTDAGLGLRFGIARAPSNNILRIDFAYAFNPDPRGRRGVLVSFSSAQAF